jgi:hypothetical protein
VPQAPNGPPKIPKEAHRVSRIYVSELGTAYNGRLNWNIPKHLARFSFSEKTTSKYASPPTSLTAQVFPPNTSEGDNVPPFFTCTLKPWTWVPAVSVNTRFLPKSMAFAQPPVPEASGHQAAVKKALMGPNADQYDLNPQNEAVISVGTTRWCAFDVAAKVSRARGCWVEFPATKDESNSSSDKEKTWFPSGLKP